MKYKTRRESYKVISIVCLIIGLIGLAALFLTVGTKISKDELIMNIALELLATFCGIGMFVYTWTYNVKRNRMKKHGERFEARIIQGEWLYNAKREDSFFLLIEFYENGKRKVRYTEAYYGNPNHYLRSAACEIYKWKDKYIEANLDVLDKKEKNDRIIVPITQYKFFRSKKGYV